MSSDRKDTTPTSLLEKFFQFKSIKGALWDLDGTILDCERLYDEALHKAAARAGLPPLTSEEAESMHGMTLENEILFYLSSAKQSGSSVSYEDLEKLFWLEFNRIDWNRNDLVLRGVKEACLAFDQAGIVQSLATMSTETEVLAKEPAASEIYKRMKHRVFWGDPAVKKPKPAPGMFFLSLSC
jgi:beta-phosphoglucomutase-like phosphatase (HAD superfamily)